MQRNPGQSTPLVEKVWVTRSGKAVTLRPIAPTDQALTNAFVQNLSFATKYFRFGRGDMAFSPEQLAVICNPDPRLCRRLIALITGPAGDIQIGSAAFAFRPDKKHCDLTITIADGWQGTRVAHYLMSMLIETARECGVFKMYAQVLATNRRMQAFAQRHGFQLLASDANGGVREFCLSLHDESAPATS